MPYRKGQNMESNELKNEFGCLAFTDDTAKRYLDKESFLALKEVKEKGIPLDGPLAEKLAHALKTWALENGATHFTHWFQPLNGITAEKHDSFLSGIDEEGKAILSFSGKELIKSEPDASSFPSGGLRATFEARGYTAYDCTSPAFLYKDDSSCALFLPTAFCSYTNEALDEKTPLLRSMDYLSEQAVKALRLLGDEKTNRVITYAGAEQEYFLLEGSRVAKRKDLAYTGRTLVGAPAPKGQELEDHYFGPIRTQVASFMSEVNRTLWKLGVPARTEHNEVAPSQHELATIYSPCNIAADQNQLVMLVLRRTAKKHGLVCVLDEKPFVGVNGSGKHNNWSIGTDTGINLLKPGKEPENNLIFQAFLTAIVAATDEYAPLLRESAATYANDHRLGGDEAPPAIVSVFLGENLEELVHRLIEGKNGSHSDRSIIDTGAKSLPLLYKDNTDRNRTSPFAFTGNKFEFRMVGSNQNISEANTVLNTAVGYELSHFVDFVSKSDDKETAIKAWIQKTLKEHTRIVFSGDGYSPEWKEEAKRRGLPELKTAVEATEALSSEPVKQLFRSSRVLTESELASRQEIKFANYASASLIDAKTLSHLAHKALLPAANRYLALLIRETEQYELSTYANQTLDEVNKLIDEGFLALKALDEDIVKAKELKGHELAVYCRDVLLFDMKKVRTPLDKLELIVDKSYWPIPSYGDLLFHTI